MDEAIVAFLRRESLGERKGARGADAETGSDEALLHVLELADAEWFLL